MKHLFSYFSIYEFYYLEFSITLLELSFFLGFLFTGLVVFFHLLFLLPKTAARTRNSVPGPRPTSPIFLISDVSFLPTHSGWPALLLLRTEMAGGVHTAGSAHSRIRTRLQALCVSISSILFHTIFCHIFFFLLSTNVFGTYCLFVLFVLL